MSDPFDEEFLNEHDLDLIQEGGVDNELDKLLVDSYEASSSSLNQEESLFPKEPLSLPPTCNNNNMPPVEPQATTLVVFPIGPYSHAPFPVHSSMVPLMSFNTWRIPVNGYLPINENTCAFLPNAVPHVCVNGDNVSLQKNSSSSSSTGSSSSQNSLSAPSSSSSPFMLNMHTCMHQDHVPSSDPSSVPAAPMHQDHEKVPSYDQLGQMVQHLRLNDPGANQFTPSLNGIESSGASSTEFQSMTSLTKRGRTIMRRSSQQAKRVKKRHYQYCDEIAYTPSNEASSSFSSPSEDDQQRWVVSSNIESDTDSQQTSSSLNQTNTTFQVLFNTAVNDYLHQLGPNCGVILTSRVRQNERLYALLPAMTNCCGNSMRFSYCSSNRNNPYRYIMVYRLEDKQLNSEGVGSDDDNDGRINTDDLKLTVEPNDPDYKDQFVGILHDSKMRVGQLSRNEPSFIAASFSISKVGKKQINGLRWRLCMTFRDRVVFQTKHFLLVSKDKTHSHLCQESVGCFRKRTTC
nr:unnamed protein product [Naegleria fowleri]